MAWSYQCAACAAAWGFVGDELPEAQPCPFCGEVTAPQESIAAIGEHFAATLRGWLTPQEFAQMRERNASGDYSDDSCASHDFCDANMAMLPAFQKVMGRDPGFLTDPDDARGTSDLYLWGYAWDYAKREHLTA